MLNPTPAQITRMEQSLSADFKTTVSNFTTYHDGFSFTVPTELDAYKAAYKYQGCKQVIVREAPNVSAWSVQVYTNN